MRAHDLVAAAAHRVNAGLLERPQASLAMGPVEGRGKTVEGQDHLENHFSLAPRF
jgi:hypothetical protein